METQTSLLGMSRRTLLGRMGILAGGALLASCGIPFGDKPAVGIVLGSLADPFYLKLERAALKKAEEIGNLNVIVDGPIAFDVPAQVQTIKNLMARNIKVLVISPVSRTNEDLLKAIKEAHDAGVKIITVDTALGDGDYTSGSVTFPIAHIGSNHQKGGILVAQSLIKGFGGLGSLVLDDQLEAEVNPAIANKPTFDRTYTADYLKVLQETSNQITQGFKAYAETSKISLAGKAQALAASDESFGIFATQINKTIPEGLYRKLLQKIVADNDHSRIKVAVYDAYESTNTAIRSGTIHFAVAQNVAQMGQKAIEYASDALNSKAVPKLTETDFLVIDRNSIETPAGQAAIYRSN